MKYALTMILLMISLSFIAAQENRWPIKPVYDEASAFRNGVAHVIQHDSILFINKEGKVLRRFLKRNVGIFNEGLASIQVAPDKYGYLNESGEVVIQARFSYVHDFVDGISMVVEKNLMGGIDKSGKYIIPLKYHSLHDVSEGLIGAQDATTKKWGFLDKTGKQVIPFKYDNLKSAPGVLPFSEGLAAVYLNDKAGYIDKTGKMVIAPQFGQGNSFEGGYADVYNEDGAYFIDKTGKIVPQPTRPAKPAHEIKTDPRFPHAEEVGEASEGLMPAKRNGKWGYVAVSN